MRDDAKLISTQIKKDIPQYIRMEYPNFVAFIEYYYEWMQEKGAPYHFIANSLNYADVDRTSLAFLEEFGKNFLNPLPDVIYDNNNIATLVKNIEQYYSARGSEKAFKFLFRLFEYKDNHDRELEFYYPSYDMLRVSDGKWVNEKSIKIIDPPEDVLEWEGGQVTGKKSGAKGIIDEIKVYKSSSNVQIAEIFIIEFDIMHRANKFICGEEIEIVTKELKTYVANIEKVLYGIEFDVDTNGEEKRGHYYISDQRVKLINIGDGVDGRVVIDNIEKGSVEDFEIISGGTDYSVGDKVYTSNNETGSNAYGKVSKVDATTGEILGIDLIFGGHNYSSCKHVYVESVNGKDAVLMIKSSTIGRIKSLEIRNFGINYSPANTQVVFNTIIRIYEIHKDGFIGEKIVGENSGAEGIVEYWDKDSNVISVNVLSSTPFIVGEKIVGQRYGGNGIIYDMYIAEGKITEGCLCNYKGRYINMDGHISSLKYIQDSYFYQMFSYMLKTTKDKSEWNDMIKNVHPAGTIGFSYRDVTSNYIKESYGGFISPCIDTTEFYKFRWVLNGYNIGGFSDYSNTQIKDYGDIVIDDIANILSNKLNKTDKCYGSEVTVI